MRLVFRRVCNSTTEFLGIAWNPEDMLQFHERRLQTRCLILDEFRSRDNRLRQKVFLIFP